MIRRGLKGIDFYKNIPSDYKEGTVAGACISIISISTLIVLTFSAISTYMTPVKVNDLIIDQKHVLDQLKVNIDIQFPYVPCSLLSLDVENKLRVHLVNIKNNVKKIIIPSGEDYNDEGFTLNQRIQRIKQDLKNKVGCRMLGDFGIDRVPGNFHFSNHGYNHQTMMAFNPALHFSHKIHHMYFGDLQPENKIENTLGEFNSQKQIPEGFLGISCIQKYNKLKWFVQYNVGYHRETFFYTARINEVNLYSVSMVYFKYQTNAMTQLEIGQYTQFHNFLIQIVAIIGGIYTVASIVDQIIHSSIRFIVKKHQMGKLM